MENSALRGFTMEEKQYRQLVDDAFHRISIAFDAIDPDLAECEYSQGAVSISFANRTKCILSTQPSVRQVWLAAASLGIAHHFNYSESEKKWLDDKGKGVELISFVQKVVKDAAGVDLKL
jgi:CyaY protein